MASRVTFCKKCGSLVEENLTHCPHCNTILEDEFESIKTLEQEKKKLESFIDSLEIRLVESEIPYREYSLLKKKWANRLADVEDGITATKRRLLERSEAYLYLKSLDVERIPEEYESYLSDKEFFNREKEGFKYAIKSLYHLNAYFELENEYLKRGDEKRRNEIERRMDEELEEAKKAYAEGIKTSGREKVNFILRYVYKDKDVYVRHKNWTCVFSNLAAFHATDKLLIVLDPEYLEEFRKRMVGQFNSFFTFWSSTLYKDEPQKIGERENILEKSRSEKERFMMEDIKKIRKVYTYSFKRDFGGIFDMLVGENTNTLEIYRLIEEAKQYINNLKRHKNRPEKIREDLENINNALRLLVREIEREKDLLE